MGIIAERLENSLTVALISFLGDENSLLSRNSSAQMRKLDDATIEKTIQRHFYFNVWNLYKVLFVVEEYYTIYKKHNQLKSLKLLLYLNKLFLSAE